jgi:hypothetical protein
MANRALENPQKAGALTAEVAGTDEVDGLLHSAALRLANAEIDTLSLESRFDLASIAGWQAIGPRPATRSFRSSRTRSALQTSSGASSTTRTANETRLSTTVSSTLIVRLWRR